MDEFEALLLARRAEVLAALELTSDELAGIRLAKSDGTADDEHDPEGSTLSTDWSRIESLRATASESLAEVDRAIGRIHEGTFGMCLSCGNPIPDARLRVRPWAEHCVACAARLH